MKNRFLWLFLALILVFTFAGSGWSDEGKEPCTIMKPDRETLERWIQKFESAPRAYIDEQLMLSIPLRGSYSLLSHLQYTPSERNQGICGNCWAWAGSGVMGIALDVEESILDRLSVQYLNSCKSSSYACCGGNLGGFADFYTSTGQAIPWSNTNASFQDAGRKCEDGSSLVSCASISTSPNYPIDFIDDLSITTHGVGQAAAIKNIKNVLHQNKAIYFGYCLATGADWNNFRTFWNTQGENVIWNPDFSCGHTWVEKEGGCHAVLCVGYNDDDPNNPYWIMVNSWGTPGDRPNGIFRLDMDMNYDCTFWRDGNEYWSFYWQTLDIDFGPVDICECDLNHDGKCDMQDWLLFGEDWGRTDCPIPSMMNEAAGKVAPNNNPSGDPNQAVQEQPSVKGPIMVENALPDGNQPELASQKAGPRRAVPRSNAQEKNPAIAVTPTPVWQGLETLSQADRENAMLALEVSEDLPTSVLEECKTVEKLWNSGQFSEAIEALQAIEADGVPVAAGVNWKTPRAVDNLKWWDDDVRIGTRTYIYQKVLDFDVTTGNLFAVLKYSEDPRYYFSVNISTDDGQTWQESYTWWSSKWIVDVDVAVMGSHLYVAYVDEVFPTRGKLRRFYTSNGASDTGYGHLTVFDKGTNIWEIAFTSNVDSYDNKIYYFAISAYNLCFYYGQEDGTTWTEQATGINYAFYGLDACWNEYPDDYYQYVSFVGLIIGEAKQDQYPLVVARWTGGTWDAHQFEDEPPADTNTAIAAYDNRVMVVFESEYTHDSGVKYWVSYNAGDNWRYGSIAVPALPGNYFAGPDLAGRKGGGFAVVYAEEAGAFDPCWYRHRDYGTGPGTAPWSDPEQFNEHDVLSLEDLASEWVPPLPGYTYACGAIYAANDSYAYFDRSDGGPDDICECDLNHDGKCDMQDWLLFGEDWGRTDCPIP